MGQWQSKAGSGHDGEGSVDSSLAPFSLWAADRLFLGFFGMLTIRGSQIFACTPRAF